jgi:hypothetical protein
MSSLVEGESENRITRGKHGEKYCKIRGGSRKRLYIHVLRPKKLFCTIYGEIFRFIDKFLPGIIAFSRVSF